MHQLQIMSLDSHKQYYIDQAKTYSPVQMMEDFIHRRRNVVAFQAQDLIESVICNDLTPDEYLVVKNRTSKSVFHEIAYFGKLNGKMIFSCVLH